MKGEPDHLIVYVETNGLNSEVSSKSIAESIVHLVMSLKTKSNYVGVSNMVLRRDNPLLKQKKCEFNSHLKDLCEKRNLHLKENTYKN